MPERRHNAKQARFGICENIEMDGRKEISCSGEELETGLIANEGV